MKTTIALGISLLIAAGALTTNAVVGGEAKEDLAKLQGTWTAEKDGKKITLSIKKSDFTFLMPGPDDKDVNVKGTIKIDPAKKPKTMDLKVTEGDKYKGKTSLAIYDVDGDTMRWCATEPGGEERATEFAEKEGVHLLNLKFKRAK